MDDVGTFDRFARGYDLLVPRADPWRLKTGLAHARRPVERVVDLAGGSGQGVRAIDAVDGVVVDAAPGMVHRAASHGLDAVVGDAGRIPLGDGRVDAVLIVDALHHVPDIRGALGEAARVLAPGGVVVIAEFDPTTLRGRLLAGVEHLVGFDSRFTPPDALADELAAVGLDPIVVDGGFGYVLAGVSEREE